MYFTDSQIQIFTILIVFLLFTTGIGSYKLGCNHTTEKYITRKGTTSDTYTSYNDDFKSYSGENR
jgi:hypothetical protein